jgi:ADP-heptose:LPS heptosyltransferase
MPDRAVSRILVVDLLGGLGDLVMALPVVHALHRRHPDAELHVLTHAPGDALMLHDPAVTAVVLAERGRERAAVLAELDRRRPDLAVTTTRYDGIADAIEELVPRSVTDLWRGPPPDEPVASRYLRILAEEDVIHARDVDLLPSIVLTGAERAEGEEVLGSDEQQPVVLVPSSGMAVKEWPHWRELATALAGRAFVVGEPPVLDAWRGGPARLLPPMPLRGLAALFAAVGRRGGVVVGPDTGPMRMAAAVGARTVGIFGPTLASRYGLGAPGVDLQGLPGCTHRRPTAITEQVCWWEARCPLSALGPACMADVAPGRVLDLLPARQPVIPAQASRSGPAMGPAASTRTRTAPAGRPG